MRVFVFFGRWDRVETGSRFVGYLWKKSQKSFGTSKIVVGKRWVRIELCCWR